MTAPRIRRVFAPVIHSFRQYLAKGGGTAEAYLLSDDKKLCRKWRVGGAGEVDVVIEPGDYTLYVRTRDEEKTTSRRASLCKFKVEYKKRYAFTIQ